jgi:signal peptidase I
MENERNMSKLKKTDRPRQETPSSGEKTMSGYIGIALALAGGYCVIKTGQDLSGKLDWLWWSGLAVAVVGTLMYLWSGMSFPEIVSWCKSAGVAIAVALAIRWSVGEPYRIPSGSMEPTLHGDASFGKGDRVFVNKWIYGLRYPFMNKRIWQGQDPQRWDIVVFKAVGENPRHSTLVKRIVALPGEKVEFLANGEILANERGKRARVAEIRIDGEALEIPDFMPKDQRYTLENDAYSNIAPYGARPEEEYSMVPEGHYLVLGDNSGNSRDGRFFGWLPEEHIVGRVACIWWWPNHWRDFTGFSQTLWWKGLVGFLGLFTVIRLLVGRSWAMPQSTGRGQDHYFISFLAYGLSVPFSRMWLSFWAQAKRGDLVLYQPDSEHVPPGTLLLGRVAGLPEESVSVRQGPLEINGAAPEGCGDWVNADYREDDGQYGLSKNKARTEVPQGHYYVLGLDPGSDDDQLRLDSRTLGWVPKTQVAGKAMFRWWPLGKK